MKFKKEDLQSLVYDESTDLIKIREEMVDSSRWSLMYDLVFKYDDHYFRVSYSIGATEQQDECAFEYSLDLIDCVEVWPEVVEKIIFTVEDPGYTTEGLAKVEELL